MAFENFWALKYIEFSYSKVVEKRIGSGHNNGSPKIEYRSFGNYGNL
jgi:hypothetical protein